MHCMPYSLRAATWRTLHRWGVIQRFVGAAKNAALTAAGFHDGLTLLPHLDPDALNRILTYRPLKETANHRHESKPPRVSIIIVTYNNLPLTKLCLESIARNTEYANSEVIVVDNRSTDNTPAYLQRVAHECKWITFLLNDRNEGFARANNQGIARARGDFLVLLNNDTIVPPGWLEGLLWHLQDRAIGLVGPVSNFVGNEARVEVYYRTWEEMESFARYTMRRNARTIADIHMLAMFCVAFRREIYDAIGPLDEQFGVGMFEDDDYSLRIKRAGYRVVCAPGVFVHHFGRAAFEKLEATGEYNSIFAQNRERFEKKWNLQWQPHRSGSLRREKHAIAARS
ncbi:MAG: glycosyltransferase family 2 protein [Deltaproteobacteria bacterium]|nr:glycosyltransferase family 2 protein [Deltaproteobacteria bacterium]